MALALVHYLVARKNRHHGEAIAEGFRARTVPAERRQLERNARHLIGGLQHGSLELMRQARAAGEPYIFFDRAYFGGGPGTDRLRVVPSAYQHHWVGQDRDGLRFAATGVRLQDWRPEAARGGHVMVVPPSGAIEQLFGLSGWLDQVLARIRSMTDREIRVSRKGDPVPLSTRLHNCRAVVAYTSNVAVEAVCAGIPVFVSRRSAAYPVAHGLDTEYRDDLREFWDRQRWAEALAWGQFTVHEIRAGMALEAVKEHFR